MNQSVCLIIPPSGFLLDERVFMSLGILRVAAVLEGKGISVEVLDLSGISNYLEAIADYAKTTKARIFGLTATTPQLPAAVAVAHVIRSVRKDTRILLGGPHVTLVNAAQKQERQESRNGRAIAALRQLQDVFDVSVAGDGERAIFEALKPDAPSVIDADDPKSPDGLFLKKEQLEESPFPARHLVDVASYHYRIEGERALSVMAQLGCPFGCRFCGGRISPSFRRVRMRSSENIVSEMVSLYRTYGMKAFMLYDDELNVNKNLVGLMDRITEAGEELGVAWKLRGFIKAELFTDEQAAAMYRAGFRWILVGFESGASSILEVVQKRATLADNTRCMEIAKRHGLKVKALMSIGHPGETKETVEQTRKWLLDVKPDDFDVTIITCYPGTPYYDEAVLHKELPGIWVYTDKKSGTHLYQINVDYLRVADYYKGNPDGGYQSYVFTDNLSPADLIRLRDGIEREVRERLNIPFNPSAPAMLYEHSMGQGGVFPGHILRISPGKT